MIDTTGMASTDGVILNYGTSAPAFNGNNPFQVVMVFRLKSGTTNRDTFSTGQKLNIVRIADFSDATKERCSLRFFNNGSSRFLQGIIQLAGYSSCNALPSDFGASTWTELEDKMLVACLSYRGSASVHQLHLGYWNGSAIVTGSKDAGANVGVNNKTAPEDISFGADGSETNQQNGFTDYFHMYVFHDTIAWTGTDFSNVVKSLIDETTGELRSLGNPIDLNTGNRTGPTACNWFGPCLRDRSTSFTNKVLPGTELASTVKSAGIKKTTGMVEGTATTVGSGAGPDMLDPADFWQPNPDVITPANQQVGSLGLHARQFKTDTYTRQTIVLVMTNSRIGRPDDGRGNTNAGVTPVLNGYTLNASQYPDGKMSAGSGYGSGLALARPDNIVGFFSLMPQGPWTANSTPRKAQVCVDVASASGSAKTATIVDGSTQKHNQNAQRLSIWDNIGSSGTGTVGCGQPIYIAPGQYVDLWGHYRGAMDPDGDRVLSVVLGKMPTNAGGTSVEISALSHGAVTDPSSYPTSTPDFVGDPSTRTITGTLRGSNNNPTVDIDGTAIVVPPGNTTGDQPEVSDICMIESASLSPHAISVFDSVPDGSGNATFEFGPITKGAPGTVLSPTLSWGPYSVVKHEIGLQSGEPDADGPHLGVRISVDSGESDGVYLFGWGGRMAYTPGKIICEMGQGGSGYADQIGYSFTTEDANGQSPLAKLFEAIGINVAILAPAEQNSTPADTQDMIDQILAGCPDCEIIGWKPPRYAEIAFSTETTGDIWGDWFVANCPIGITSVDTYSSAHAWTMGYHIDSQHLGPRGVEQAGLAFFDQIETLDLAIIEEDSSGNVYRLHPQYRALMRRRLRERLGGEDDGQ